MRMATEKVLREIVITSVRATSQEYFYFDDVIEKAVAAAMAVRHSEEAMIDAIEHSMKKSRCSFLFDDPCDEWERWIVHFGLHRDSRARQAERIANLAGTDIDGGILPPTAGGIDRATNPWWENSHG